MNNKVLKQIEETVEENTLVIYLREKGEIQMANIVERLIKERDSLKESLGIWTSGLGQYQRDMRSIQKGKP